MIADTFVPQAAAIVYPDAGARKANSEAMKEYREAQRVVDAAFGEALAEEYLYDISEARRAAVGKLTFELAWSEGHSGGYSEVENRYMDFADFALAVYTTATS